METAPDVVPDVALNVALNVAPDVPAPNVFAPDVPECTEPPPFDSLEASRV